MNAIEVKDLRKAYISREGFRKKRFVEALRGITFTVPKGFIHALLGPNGAGKSTTVKILSTLLLPDGGRASVLGFDVVSEADEVRKRIGVVLDVSKGFYPSLSGYENLIFYALLKGFSFSDARRRAKEVLDFIGLEQMNASKRPYYTYSLGMRARLAIAKALFTDPDVLLLDEPTLGLDVESARAVRKLLIDLAKSGRTILVTGHNMFEIEQIANNVTIIDKGKIIASGNPHELKSRLGLIHRVSIRVSGSDKQKLIDILRKMINIDKIDVEELGDVIKITVYVRSSREEIAQILFEVSRRLDVKVLDLSIEEPTLEDMYLALIGVHS